MDVVTVDPFQQSRAGMSDMENCNERNMPFLEQVRKNTPRWAHDIIQRWDDKTFRLAEDFVTHSYWIYQGSINVFRIIGTIDQEYAGMSWLEFLEYGKWMDANIALIEKNPVYYEHYGTPVGMNFISLDGINWYVNTDGNHRSCLARFYFHLKGLDNSQLHNVSLNLFHVDWVFFNAYQKLQALLPSLHERGYHGQLHVRRTIVEREDQPGWKMDRFHTVATLTLDVGKSAPDVKTFEFKEGNEALHCLSFLEQQLSSASPTWERDDHPPEHEKLPWWRRFTGRKNQ